MGAQSRKIWHGGLFGNIEHTPFIWPAYSPCQKVQQGLSRDLKPRLWAAVVWMQTSITMLRFDGGLRRHAVVSKWRWGNETGLKIRTLCAKKQHLNGPRIPKWIMAFSIRRTKTKRNPLALARRRWRSQSFSRVPADLPEGIWEGFANLVLDHCRRDSPMKTVLDGPLCSGVNP